MAVHAAVGARLVGYVVNPEAPAEPSRADRPEDEPPNRDHRREVCYTVLEQPRNGLLKIVNPQADTEAGVG